MDADMNVGGGYVHLSTWGCVLQYYMITQTDRTPIYILVKLISVYC